MHLVVSVVAVRSGSLKGPTIVGVRHMPDIEVDLLLGCSGNYELRLSQTTGDRSYIRFLADVTAGGSRSISQVSDAR